MQTQENAVKIVSMVELAIPAQEINMSKTLSSKC